MADFFDTMKSGVSSITQNVQSFFAKPAVVSVPSSNVTSSVVQPSGSFGQPQPSPFSSQSLSQSVAPPKSSAAGQTPLEVFRQQSIPSEHVGYGGGGGGTPVVSVAQAVGQAGPPTGGAGQTTTTAGIKVPELSTFEAAKIGLLLPAQKEIAPITPPAAVSVASTPIVGGIESSLGMQSPEVQEAVRNLQMKVKTESPGFKLASWTREGDELKGVLEPMKYVSLGTDVTKVNAAIRDLGLEKNDYKLYESPVGDFQLVTGRDISQSKASGLLSSYSVVPITGAGGSYTASDEKIAIKFLEKEGYITDGKVSKDVQIIGDFPSVENPAGTGSVAIVLKGSGKSSSELSKTYFEALAEVQKEETAMAKGELQIGREKELLKQPGMSVEKGAAWWNLNVGPYLLSSKDILGLRSAEIGVEGLIKGTPIDVIGRDIEASKLEARGEYLTRKYMGESDIKSLWEAPAMRPAKMVAAWYGGGAVLGGVLGGFRTVGLTAGIVSKAPWVGTVGKVVTSVPGQVVGGVGLYGFAERENIAALAKGEAAPRDIIPGMAFDASQFLFGYAGAKLGAAAGYPRGAGLGYAFKPGALPVSETFIPEARGTGVPAGGAPGELQGLTIGTRVAGTVPKGFVPKGFSEGVPYRGFLQEGTIVTRTGEVIPSTETAFYPTVSEMQPAKPLLQRISTAMRRPTELIPKMLPGGPSMESPYLESIRYGGEMAAKGGTKNIYETGYEPGTTVWTKMKMPAEGAKYGIAESVKTVTTKGPLGSALTERFGTRIALRTTATPIEAEDVVPVKVMSKMQIAVKDEGIAAELKSGKNLADIEKLGNADIIQQDITAENRPTIRYTRFLDRNTGSTLLVMKQTVVPTAEEVMTLAEEGRTLIKPFKIGGKVAGYTIRGTEIVGEGEKFAGGVRYKKGVEVIEKKQVTGISLDDKTFNLLQEKYGNKILLSPSPTSAADIAALESSAKGGVAMGTTELSAYRYVPKEQFENYLNMKFGGVSKTSGAGGEFPSVSGGTAGTISGERVTTFKAPPAAKEERVTPLSPAEKRPEVARGASEGERVMAATMSEIERPVAEIAERPLRFTEKYYGISEPSFETSSAGIIGSDIAIARKSVIMVGERLSPTAGLDIGTMLKPSTAFADINIKSMLPGIDTGIKGGLRPSIRTDITDIGVKIEPLISPITTTRIAVGVDIIPRLAPSLTTGVRTRVEPTVPVSGYPFGGGGGDGKEGEKPKGIYGFGFGRGKVGKKAIRSDLFSVAVAQAAYGKATTPRFTGKEVSELERRGFMRVPTAEMRGIPSSREVLKGLLG